MVRPRSPRLAARVSPRVTVGGPGERFGDQVVQLLGAAEHRSERIDRCVSEERRLQQRRWAAWAPKIRSASPVSSLVRQAAAQLLQSGGEAGVDQVVAVLELEAPENPLVDRGAETDFLSQSL